MEAKSVQEKELSPKVEALYQAVFMFFEEGADLGNLTVAEVAARAGIGKGTVYEYFSNKEEMMANALYHKLKEFSKELQELIVRENCLYNKMLTILQSIEKNRKDTNVSFRLIQVIDDRSEVGRRLQEMLRTKSKEDLVVVDVVRHMMEEELEPQMRQDETGIAYLTMMVFSRIFCYGMSLGPCTSRNAGDSERVQALLCQGICDDVKNYKERWTWESATS